MANLFLELDGIEGESQDEKHSSKIEIDSASWGVSSSATYAVGGGGGGHNTHVQDLTVSATMDKGIIPILQRLVKGKHIDKGKVICRKTAGDSPIEYMVYEMEDIVVSSASMSHSTGMDLGMVSYSFNFKKITVKYTPQNADQSAGSEIPMSYDQQTSVMT